MKPCCRDRPRDLGSSISASTGERHVIDSYVGWPVDMVARKLVKKPVLVGHEARKTARCWICAARLNGAS